MQIPYIRIEELDKNNYQKEYCRGLDLYSLKITSIGQYFEMSLMGFSNESKQYSNSLNYLINYFTMTRTSSNNHQVQLNIDLIDLSLICHSSQEKIVRSRLLMPGPVPFQTISNGELSISQGYDALLLPFKEIVFFAYPGKNLQRIVKQFGLYKEIFSEEPTRISNADLLFSIEHMNKSKRYEFPSRPSIEDNTPQKITEGDTVFDAAVRTELLDESRASEDEKEELVTLKEIWTRIGRKKSMTSIEGEAKTTSTFSPIQREQITLKVKFDDGREDSIAFMSGTLIRRRSGEDYVLTQIDDLTEDDEILYIESNERESIDNYLLRDFVQEKGISLEQIFEPFTCLRLFYETLNSVDYFGDYPAEAMKKLYWLDETQNTVLFKTIQLLLREPTSPELDMLLHDVNNIYSGQISSEQLTQTFTGRRIQITYDMLFKLAQFVGLSLAEPTFKQYSTFALNEHHHYYFKNDKDLLALGRLIGHQRIIDDYQIINSQGRDVGTILQIIGRSIARVTRGISDQFSEMDASIEGKVQRCTVITVILPENT
jgi:hypothetical protein